MLNFYRLLVMVMVNLVGQIKLMKEEKLGKTFGNPDQENFNGLSETLTV